MGILSRFIKSKVKGPTGELKTNILLSFLDQSQYRVINNFMAGRKGRSCQIDPLVISPYGLFVIETKNRSGWIFANENSEYWTQVNYRVKSQLYNPIRQNDGHINVLKYYLQRFQNIRYVSIVVFSSKVTFKTKIPENCVYYHGLIGMIKSFSTPCMTATEANELFDVLSQINGTHDHDKRAHVKNIRQTIDTRNAKINSGICPRCGGNLVPRNGKYGTFYGCSNYPQCRFTNN